MLSLASHVIVDLLSELSFSSAPVLALRLTMEHGAPCHVGDLAPGGRKGLDAC
jgi:hypothetical protein